MKVLICGDVHFNYLAPSSRVDDYGQTILKKVEWLFEYCVKNDIKYLFFLGDIFHQNQQPIWYLNQVTTLFAKYKEVIEIYTIVGNHDLSYGRIDSLPRTPLGNLIGGENIKRLSRLELDGSVFCGADYSEPIPPATSEYDVLLAHVFYNQPFDRDVLTKNDIISLGYTVNFFGHDHNAYHPVKFEESKQVLYRFGSLSRGTSHTHHLIRDIEVAIFDSKSRRVRMISVPHEPSENVFTNEALKKYKREATSSLLDFRDSLSALVESMTFKEDQSDIWEAVNSMNLEPELYDVVTHYLNQKGIV